MTRCVTVFCLTLLLLADTAWAAIYSGPTDTAHGVDPAIPANSPRFVQWASAIDPSRTYFAPGGSTAISPTALNSLGELNAAQIAAGDSPGYLTVTFPGGIFDGPGPDFAVFENGFVFPRDPYLFAELAYVEVSSNGTDFARFPSVSLNTTHAGDFGPSFAGYDSTNLYNLAGKHAAGFGTPFDLDDLFSDPLVQSGAVDLRGILYVKLVDIPGNGSFRDSLGNPILDNWPTDFPGVTSAGFDFRLPAGLGVGVIHAIPEPPGAAIWLLGVALACMAAARIRRGRLGSPPANHLNHLNQRCCEEPVAP